MGLFWGTPTGTVHPVRTAPANRRAMVGATGLAVAGTLTISLFAGTLFDLSDRAADELRNSQSYIAEVVQ
jgi:hypothetical protein